MASQLDLINMMADLYGDGLFPVLLCPPYLFLDILKINHLRFQAIRFQIDRRIHSICRIGIARAHRSLRARGMDLV